MGYVIAGLIVLVILAIGISLLVASSRRAGKERDRAASDPSFGEGVPGSDMGIVAEEKDSPLGDTTEHAGEQEDGETVSGQDADRSGGTGRPTSSGAAGTTAAGEETEHVDAAHVSRPAVGGEAEGHRKI